MYNYDFTNEKAVYENRNSIIDINNKTYNLAIIITNKNILFFNDINKNHVLNSRGMSMPSNFLLELKIPKNKCNYVFEEGNTYLKYQKTDIILYKINLNLYM